MRFAGDGEEFPGASERGLFAVEIVLGFGHLAPGFVELFFRGGFRQLLDGDGPVG